MRDMQDDRLSSGRQNYAANVCGIRYHARAWRAKKRKMGINQRTLRQIGVATVCLPYHPSHPSPQCNHSMG
jgi:hypothetical protein